MERHRRNKIGVAAYKHIITDNAYCLVKSVVIACYCSTAKIDVLPDLGVAYIGQMTRPRVIADRRILNFYKGTDRNIITQNGFRTDMTIWTNLTIFTNNTLIRNRVQNKRPI